jgi:hypothetical protein
LIILQFQNYLNQAQAPVVKIGTNQSFIVHFKKAAEFSTIILVDKTRSDLVKVAKKDKLVSQTIRFLKEISSFSNMKLQIWFQTGCYPAQ